MHKSINYFAKFLEYALEAHAEGRLNGMERLVCLRTDKDPEVLRIGDLFFEILAPVATCTSRAVSLPTFPNPHHVSKSNPHPKPSESHTVNGNSIVLRLAYGKSTFLFAGDLNYPAQQYLAEKYSNMGVFRADVHKACHHGSSDYALCYVQAVAPFATVFSSGDAGQYDHPLPDAVGTAAKWSRCDQPLVFSTELARETNSKGKVTLLGHINARSNGKSIVMAQKMEKPSSQKTWHSYELPFEGPFAGASDC